jgi:hypothetical protein
MNHALNLAILLLKFDFDVKQTLASGHNPVVELSPQHPKVGGLSPVTSKWTENVKKWPTLTHYHLIISEIKQTIKP